MGADYARHSSAAYSGKHGRLNALKADISKYFQGASDQRCTERLNTRKITCKPTRI